jgi:3-oxoacyl-[acyl-carrier protein] reductase
VLVCNAGTGCRFRIWEVSDEEFDRVFDVNVRGVLNTVRAAIPFMMEEKSGKIITVSSVIAKTGGGRISKSTYAASKAAVIGYTRGIAREAAPYGITANVVCPGGVAKEGMGGGRPAGFEERAAADIPLGRLAAIQDVAAAVVFLATDGGRYITGSTIDVNGGALMD